MVLLPQMSRLRGFVLCAIGLFAAGWLVQGWRLSAQISGLKTTHAETLRDISEKTLAAQAALNKYNLTNTKALAQLDEQKTQEVTNAKLETARLRRCIAAGTCGVRLNSAASAASSRGAADASASSVDNGTTPLDAALQQRILDLRDAITLDAAALEYLQEYALRCQAWPPEE